MRSLAFLFSGVAVIVLPIVAQAAPASPPPSSAPTEASAAPAPASAPPAVATTPATKTEALETPPKDEPKDEDHSVYLSISPFHLFAPIVELTGEVRLHRKIGVAAIGAYGSLKADGIPDRFSVYEVGGQFVSYPIGHFDHGMQLGAEALFAGIATSTKIGAEKISGEGQGLSLSPFIGYKFAAKVGFSLNVQGGVSYLAVRAQASSPTQGTATASKSAWGPLLNFNLGWSF